MVRRLPPRYQGAESRSTGLAGRLLEDGTSVCKLSCEFRFSQRDVHIIRDSLDAWVSEDLLVIGMPVSLLYGDVTTNLLDGRS